MKENKNSLTQNIRNGIKPPFSEELIRLIQPSIRLTPTANSTRAQLSSKFGGIPLMKKGEAWPRNVETNNPYAFLLQVDLESLSVFSLDHLLPKKGLISVWFDLDSWDHGRIDYYKDKSELIQAKTPVELQREKERRGLPIWKRLFTSPTNFKIFPEMPIDFKVEFHSPSWDSLQIKQFLLKNKLDYKDLEISESFIDNYCESKESKHNLLGYYVGLQESIYELMPTTKGNYPVSFSKKLIEEGLKWKLLFQIDSDDRIEMCWADWGKLLFFIQEEDLINQNFGNLLVQLDST